MSDDQLLSRWMNKELSPEEEEQWKQHADYKHWQKIQHAIEQRALPPLDKVDAYNQLHTSLSGRRKGAKVRRLPLTIGISIAASLALLLAFWLLLPAKQSWSTPYASKDTIALPDGSTAQLNADSRLSYTENITGTKRILELAGEAFFDVKKGEAFVVQTDNGKVEVLGTQFNVLSRANQFKVYCTEGLVAVTYKGKTTQIKAGERISPIEQQEVRSHNYQSAPWAKGSSEFTNTPLPFVFEELERQYDVSIQHNDLSDRRYTGRFPHNNLENALSIICGAMQLNFTFTDDKTIQIND
jgi:transmembrane sensor